jgi:hypothetical protein
MKLIRLPSGPLACVYPLREPDDLEEGKDSGVYRAFSGSVEAEGVSEAQAIAALDREVRRLSVPPPAEIAEFELSRGAANDGDAWHGPGIADASGRFPRYSEPETLPAPTSSSSSSGR